MINKLFKLVAVLAIGLMTLSADGCPQEAPQSFESQNGLLSQKRFDAAKEAFEEVETPQRGLGVHFNESSCLGCHAPPSDRGLPGGSSPVTELRAGHFGADNKFIPAPGGTLITAKAVGEAIPEGKALPDSENVRDLFITPSLFGGGFVECVADETLRRIAREQATQSGGRIRGLIREVPILEAPERTGVGRFGWATQHASLLSFSADAYRNEMGITSALEPKDNTFFGQPVDDGVADPEDIGGKFGEDVELFANFMRALPAPPRLLPSGQKEREEIEEGFKVFKSIGCAVCHLPELVTAKAGSSVNGGAFRVRKRWGTRNFTHTATSSCMTSGPGRRFCVRGCRLRPGGRFVRPLSGEWGRGSLTAIRFSTMAARVPLRRLFSGTRTAPRRRRRSFSACARGREQSS